MREREEGEKGKEQEREREKDRQTDRERASRENKYRSRAEASKIVLTGWTKSEIARASPVFLVKVVRKPMAKAGQGAKDANRSTSAYRRKILATRSWLRA